MRKILLAITTVFAIVCSGLFFQGRAIAVTLGTPAALLSASEAVDLSEKARQVCRRGHKCHPYAPCGTRCRVACPDGTSCYPLYGAYGPIGGIGYWGAFTSSGWGFRR
jgi:hypothetical protein